MRKVSVSIIIVMLCIHTAYAGIFAETVVPGPADIKGHWAESSLEYLYQKGILKGVSKDNKVYVLPDRPITRAEFITILTRIKPLSVVKEKVIRFDDVAEGSWYKAAVDQVASNGIVTGYKNNTFGPDRMITKAEIAVIISRAMAWDTPENSDGFSQLTGFSDVGKEQWYFKSVMLNKYKGMIGGYPDGTFRPGNNATRAEAFSMIEKLMKAMDTTGGQQPSQDQNPVPASDERQNNNGGQSIGGQAGKGEDKTPVNNPSGLVGYNISGTKGGTAYYQVYAYGMKDTASFSFNISYDSSKVAAARVIKGSLKEGDYVSSTLSSAESGSITISSGGGSGTYNDSGVIFTILFNILPEASGKTSVTLSGSVKNKDGNAMNPFSVENGSINIK